MLGGGSEFDGLDPTFSLRADRQFNEWRRRVSVLPPSSISVREAAAVAHDARAVRDLQFVCPPISVRSIPENTSVIAQDLVLLAEIDAVHIATSLAGRIDWSLPFPVVGPRNATSPVMGASDR